MPKIRIHVSIDGNNVSPDTVKASDLATFLLDVEKTIQETAAAHGRTLPEDALVSLVQIDEGDSSDMIFAVDSIVGDAPSVVTRAIATKRFDDLPRPTKDALAGIYKLASKRRWNIEFKAAPEINVERALISAEEEIPQLSPPTVTGRTVLYGVCYRVGGEDTPTASLRLPDSSKLTILVGRVLAKELAQRLYEEVGIEGECVWETDTWKVVSFKGSRLLDYRPTKLEEAFQELARLDAERWKGVDADEYVRLLRSSEEAP